MTKIGIQLKDENNNEVYPNPFPVGAVYLSVDGKNPGEIFGGTWTQVKGRFLIGADNNYKVKSAGGVASHFHGTKYHTLTLNEIPWHTHDIKSGYGDIGSASYDSYRYQYWGGLDNTWKGGSLGTGGSGGSQGHTHGNTEESNNIPPYFAVYIWYRVS